ncbi:MAG: corrinoid protein [Arenicellales bacterium]|jgi:corrinoid protein of di/trimethylamine methyltransferase|nr:corrinoid protein [Arenicellales bacterium]|tara:strand:- start:1712 stop:2395 length:684 start_codon:yes stop_codon:yes gene_type:complete
MSMVIDSEFFASIGETVIEGDDEECVRLIQQGLANGMDPMEGVEKGLAPGIRQVGDDFGAGIIFLPELTMAAKVMKAGVAILDEKIKASGSIRISCGKVVIGTVKGDIHDIGKSLVAALLQANGYDVVDLGVNVDNDTFITAAKEENADVLGMSSLLTLPLLQMGKVIEQLEETGMRDRFKVVVGGCPITQEFADEIRADAVGFDAQDAVVKVDRLLGVNRPPLGTG